MTSGAEGPVGFVRSILWRRITLGDFFNIERAAEVGPSGGGGQRYIDIPLGGSLSLEDFGNFIRGTPLEADEAAWGDFELQAFSASDLTVVAPLLFTPRRGNNRRYRIANQNRQVTGANRHPAWSAQSGFPQAPDDVASRDAVGVPDLSLLKIYIARTDRGEFLAGYTNSTTMPESWPTDTGLDVLFQPNARVGADGIIDIALSIQFSTTALGAATPSRAETGRRPVDAASLRARVVRRSIAPPATRSQGSTAASTETAVPRPDPTELQALQAPQASRAEDWVEARLHDSYGHDRVQRIGHTDLEREPLADGYLPGADFIILGPDAEEPERFVEVKSATGSLPASIRLTASELQRAKHCAGGDAPYDIWLVVFDGDQTTSAVIPDFQETALELTIEDLVSVEFQITL